MSTDELISVFIDTKEQVLNKNIATSSFTSCYDSNFLATIVDKQYVTNVEVINSDSVSAANKYSSLGKTCVLNMASAYSAGGGVATGSRAQEECLFRCSNLFETVVQPMYPLSHSQGLYTSDAVFFKDVTYNLITPFVVDVVTVAAVNLNPFAKHNDLENEVPYEETMLAKMRLMFNTAYLHECDNLILGAWGCGVFKNDPLTVAKLFYKVVEEYTGCFKNIIFAVINDHNSNGDNFNAFKSVFS